MAEPVRLRDAKLNQLDQVPFFDYMMAVNRILLVMLSACFAGYGSDSYAIGGSVFFGLCAIIGAIDRIKN